MRFHLPAILLFVLTIISCNASKTNNKAPSLTSLMIEQQNAWNTGDLVGFMEHYWQSDSLVFIGKNGLKYGWKTTLNNYQKSYPSKEAMGTLDFKHVIHTKTTGGDYRTTGNWNLYRNTDTLSGYFLLVWEFKNNRWVITADHSS